MTDTSITVTGIAQKAAWDAKQLPCVEQLRDNIWSIPVPAPNRPIRYTLSYLLIYGDDAVLIDPGLETDEGWHHLLSGLRHAGLDVTDVTGVVATHQHADHLGLAARVRKSAGAWVGMGHARTRPKGNAEDAVAVDERLMSKWGVPEAHRPSVALSAERWHSHSSLAHPDLRFSGGAELPVTGARIRTVATPGHTPDHLCLIDEDNGLIFSGDHVLPRITPNISPEFPHLTDPLADYYRSLLIEDFDDQMEVCPAHEYRFIGMRRRSARLLKLHEERAEELREIILVENPSTIWEAARKLTWSRGWQSLHGNNLRLALNETTAHVVRLHADGHNVGSHLAASVIPE